MDGTTATQGDGHRKSSSSHSDSDSDFVEFDSKGSNGSPPHSADVQDGIAQIKLNEKQSAGRKDEYDLDFEDAREFAVFRWRDILLASRERIPPSDVKIAAKHNDWNDLVVEIQGKLTAAASSTSIKRQMYKVQPLPRTLVNLTRLFSKLVNPIEVEFDVLWGLIYLNLKHSYASPDRLKRTCEVLNRIRNVVALFSRIIEHVEETNEALLAMVEFIDPITVILTDSLEHFHRCSSGAKADQEWPDLNEKINEQMVTLDGIVKNVNEMTSYTKVNMDRKIKNMSQRHALMPESEETGVFPNRILPFAQNPRFYGRQEDLEKINNHLRPTGDQSLRTYTIFGRRGVGKTEIALQFAYTNEPGFDAIFWIQCETSVAIRQSFTNVAISLNIPGAEREGRHEENLLAVQNWLKKTQKRWLMIFDNAERDQILRAYWPIGASGAILITSRKYHNFAKDMLREGNTIKPFDLKQSWDLLLRLLGNEWMKLDEEAKLPQSEITAAKNMLERLEGLALAIRQAAILIKNPKVGGPTIAKTYEMFREKARTLPERHSVPRSTSEESLDALWDMTFNSLTRNARALLGVLSWLSPDSILIEIFLPRNQKALDGPLSFCKQDPVHVNEQDRASLFSIITPSPGFDKAINELLSKELIKKDNRVLSIHRVVQEAVNFHDLDDLQQSFDVASRLVYEQFPKQVDDDSLYNYWNICQNYIHHGVHLSKKYADDYARSGIVKGSEYFVRLLSNCGWYLHEIGDYEVSKRLIDTAMAACDNKNSMLYAQLLNIAGCRYYEMNQLSHCRTAWETVLRIRKEKLPHDSTWIAGCLHNLGNIEAASGNLEESKNYFERAMMIWRAGGDATAFSLGMTYLCMGRMQMLRFALKDAETMVSLAESLFVRTIGADKGFMAHVYFAYGNIQFLQKHWELARRSYGACLEIGLSEMPIHPITAAAYYSIACVEAALNHNEVARAYLDKSRAIAELRSPTRDDGVVARILWKTATVLESDTFGTYSAEAAELRKRAEVARRDLLASGEGGLIPFIDEYEAERDEEEDNFDTLVPLFFR